MEWIGDVWQAFIDWMVGLVAWSWSVVLAVFGVVANFVSDMLFFLFGWLFVAVADAVAAVNVDWPTLADILTSAPPELVAVLHALDLGTALGIVTAGIGVRLALSVIRPGFWWG